MGMGAKLAERLRVEGCHLALCDVDVAALEAVRATCEAIAPPVGTVGALRVSVHRCDVSQRPQVAAFHAEVVGLHGARVSLLFNNAGIQVQQAFDRMSEVAFDRVMAVNLDGVVTMTRAFWPNLVAAADGAMVVNTSSVAGFLPPCGGISTPYAVSKYAVRGFSEHLMWQTRVTAPHVRVACVHPGAIQTQIVKANDNLEAGALDIRVARRTMSGAEARRLDGMTPQQRLAHVRERARWLFDTWGYSAEAAAGMIVDGVRAGQTRIMVGWDATIMDWWVRLFPRIFMSDAGTALVMLSSVVGRHFVLPATALAAAAAGYAYAKRGGGGRARL